MWDWSALTSWNNPANICSEVKEKDSSISCEGRTTIVPGFEPTIFAVLTGAAVLAMLAFWWSVVRGSKPPEAQSHLLQSPSGAS